MSVVVKHIRGIIFRAMSDTVIRVENLSKRYTIGHQRQEHYVALRDAIANTTRSLKQRFFNSNQKFEDPAHEDFWALQNIIDIRIQNLESPFYRSL